MANKATFSDRLYCKMGLDWSPIEIWNLKIISLKCAQLVHSTSTYKRTSLRALILLKGKIVVLKSFFYNFVAYINNAVISSGPGKGVGRIGSSLTSGWTSIPEHMRTTPERRTLSENYRSSSIRAVG